MDSLSSKNKNLFEVSNIKATNFKDLTFNEYEKEEKV